VALAPAPSTYGVLFRNRDLRILVASLGGSLIGDWLYNIALLAVVYQRSHSAGLLAVTGAVRILPEVIAGPVGGALVDRFDRRMLLVASDGLRGILMVAGAGLILVDGPIRWLVLIAAVSSLASIAQLACVAAVIPGLVDETELESANAARSAVGEIAFIGGPLIAGLLLATDQPALAFALNALTFLISGALVLSIGRAAAFTPPRSGVRESLLGDVRAGVVALRSNVAAIWIAGAEVLCSGVYGLLTVVLLLLVHQASFGDGTYGFLMSALGVGGIVAALATGRLSAKFAPMTLVAGGLAVTALALVGLGVTSGEGSMAAAFVATAMAGGGGIVVEIQAVTALQRLMPEDVIGRVFGLVVPATMAAIIGASAVGPLLVEAVGLTATLLGSAGMVALYAVTIRTHRR